MGKAKIGFEIEQEHLANAKAYVARHGGSLNKLVSMLFASLGQEERLHSPLSDPATEILMDVSTGKISITEAAGLLELPDAGFVLQRLARTGLPMPRLADGDVRRQINEASEALDDCLIAPETRVKAVQRRARPAAQAK